MARSDNQIFSYKHDASQVVVVSCHAEVDTAAVFRNCRAFEYVKTSCGKPHCSFAAVVVHGAGDSMGETWAGWMEQIRMNAANKKFLVVIIQQGGHMDKQQRQEVEYLSQCDGRQVLGNYPRPTFRGVAGVHLMAMTLPQFDAWRRLGFAEAALGQAALAPSNGFISKPPQLPSLIMLEKAFDEFLNLPAPTLPTLLADVVAHGKMVANDIGEGARIPGSQCIPPNKAFAHDSPLQALIDALRDPDWEIRMHAAVALGKIRSTDVLHALEECAKHDQHEEVRRIAVNALGEIGSCCRNSNELQKQVLGAHLRSAAAEALGRVGGTNTISALVRLSNDPDVGVRVAAAVGLGHAHSADAEPSLQEILKDADINVVIAAAKALSELGNNYALMSSIAQLESNCWETRCNAVTILNHIGSTEAVPALVQVLQDQIWKVRVNAALALGKISHTDAIPSLRTCLQCDDDIYVKSQQPRR